MESLDGTVWVLLVFILLIAEITELSLLLENTYSSINLLNTEVGMVVHSDQVLYNDQAGNNPVIGHIDTHKLNSSFSYNNESCTGIIRLGINNKRVVVIHV